MLIMLFFVRDLGVFNKKDRVYPDQKISEIGKDIVVFWLVNTSSSNNKTNHDMWGKNSYIYRKEYLQESDCL